MKMATKKGASKGGSGSGRLRKRRKRVGMILSKETVSTNLTEDDLTTFLGYVTGGEGKKSDVLRTLIHEAIVARELRKHGHREAGKQIRQLHEQAVEAGTVGLSKMLEEVLTICRKLNSGYLKLLTGSDVNFGILFELLKLGEGVHSMVLNDITKPVMKQTYKTGEEFEAAVSELKDLFEERAADKIENVRTEVSGNVFRDANAA
jgi:hypothetical protein